MPGLWISKTEINTRPTSGTHWTDLLAEANSTWNDPVNVRSIAADGTTGQSVMAGALAYLRLDGNSQATADGFRTKVSNHIQKLIDEGLNTSTPLGNPGLGWARQMPPWVIAADLIDLASFNSSRNTAFRSFISSMRTQAIPDPSISSLVNGASVRPNNIGTSCRFTLTLINLYLDDQTALNTQITQFKRWLGDTTANHSFTDWDASGNTWQGTQPGVPATNVGINKQGAARDGNNLDGVQPEDIRRNTPATYSAGSFPNTKTTTYEEGVLEGVLGQVEVLRRAGYDAHTWSNQAVKRAAVRIKYFADNFSSKSWVYFTNKHQSATPLVNYLYSLNYPEPYTNNPGASYPLRWTHYTHSGRTVASGGGGIINTKALTASVGPTGALTQVLTLAQQTKTLTGTLTTSGSLSQTLSLARSVGFSLKARRRLMYNLVKDASFEGDGTQWSAPAGWTYGHAVAGAPHGAKVARAVRSAESLTYLFPVAKVAVARSASYWFSFHSFLSSISAGSVAAALLQYDANGASSGPVSFLVRLTAAESEWTRHSFQVGPGGTAWYANTANYAITFSSLNATASAYDPVTCTWDVDAVQFERGVLTDFAPIAGT